MGDLNTEKREMSEHMLTFDYEKFTLLCRKLEGNSYSWIKKIIDIAALLSIEEDNDRFYIACEKDDTNGQFLAIAKADGKTEWFIPGNAYFQKLFVDGLYIIFTDENYTYYLIKVNTQTGEKIWHHAVEGDLCEYQFTKEKIVLLYESGTREELSPNSGKSLL